MAQARPLVSNDVVYFGTGNGEIVARDFETGALRWSTRIDSFHEIAGANLLLRSGLVIGAGVWVVGAVDAATGALHWTYTTPLDTVDAGGRAAPGELGLHELDADTERVYVPAWGASVSAVDLRTGQAVWVWQPGRSSTDTAANMFRSGAQGARVSGDTVFVSAWHWLDRLGLHSENWLVLLEASTGRELSRVTIPSTSGGVTAFGAPELHANLAIMTTAVGQVWAIDRASLQVVWHFSALPQFGTESRAQVHGDTVYVDGGDLSLYAIRATDGGLIWKAADVGSATRDFLVTDSQIYYPVQRELKVFDKRTGTFVAQSSLQSLDEIFETPPTYARSRVFIAITPAAVSYDEP